MGRMSQFVYRRRINMVASLFRIIYLDVFKTYDKCSGRKLTIDVVICFIIAAHFDLSSQSLRLRRTAQPFNIFVTEKIAAAKHSRQKISESIRIARKFIIPTPGFTRTDRKTALFSINSKMRTFEIEPIVGRSFKSSVTTIIAICIHYSGMSRKPTTRINFQPLHTDRLF